VIKIVEQDGENSVSRELALIKVRADAGTRSQVIEAVNLFRAKVVDVSTESLTIEATGTPEKIEALLRVLEPSAFGDRAVRQAVGSRGVPMSQRSDMDRGASGPPNNDPKMLTVWAT
jgi:acetolactate synthase-1/3 small subunit